MNQIRQLRDSQTYATRSCLLTCEAIRRQVPMVRSVQGITVTAVRCPGDFQYTPLLRWRMIETHARFHGSDGASPHRNLGADRVASPAAWNPFSPSPSR